MKKKEIYLDLSKLTQSEINWVMSVIPKTLCNYEVTDTHRYLQFWSAIKEWEVVYHYATYTRKEVTFTEFKQLCSEWGYIDALPKQLTELEKECLEMIEKLMPYIHMKDFDAINMYLDAWELTQKLKSYETI